MRLKKEVSTEKLKFTYFVNVTSDGLFTAYIPEDIIAKLEAAGISINYGRDKKKGYFAAPSLAEIQKSILAVAEKFSEKKLVLSKIILRYEI